MRRIRFWSVLALVAAACLFAPAVRSQPTKAQPLPAKAQPTKPQPKLEAVAETKLLMDGLANPNFEGLSKLFKEKPADPEAWRFARGRALLIAETGNLLMIRPPKARENQDEWMARGTELRDAAVVLGRAAAAQDYVKSRAALAGVANACNRCHRTFSVPTRVEPFPDEKADGTP